MSDPLSMLPTSSYKAIRGGKFAPKLDDEQRCSVLALVKAGVKREVVATAFGVDRRTVGHICNPSGLRYRNIREKYKAMGHEEFVKTYITEQVAKRVADASDSETETVEVKTKSPSGRASRMAGEHKVQPEQCNYEHKILIKYFKDPSITGSIGWHYADITDAKEGDELVFLHNGDDSLMTSHACYNAVLENLMDD